MKRNVFVVDFVNEKILGSKSALKKAGNPATNEYKELTSKLAAHPTFKVAKRDPNEKKNTYKGLNFPMMENYINAQPNADELMAEYEEVKKLADGKYPLVKKWFLETFKDDTKSFKVTQAKTTISDNKIKRAKATVKRIPTNQTSKSAA